ncbi:beta-lactamase class C-like protein [Actinoplanes friuliensis DSM 7358]|uniref:Beta-lactamase class C-like protein n=1 Tax=Actinoplanes friuliensis DSM 7358 TaxID=1246995 RepID=U5W8D7_9ACTN|nr:beta-lactamase class C-like protein [Actinoplanes friuliensis DSM 7358]
MAAVLAWLVAPAPPRLDTTGLPAQLTDILGDDTKGYRDLSVTVIEGGTATTASTGESLFEIGSVTKVLTGMLFADLVAEGMVRKDLTLGEAFPAADLKRTTASITLEELASQRSGLPRLAPGPETYLQAMVSGLTGSNPYAGDDVKTLLSAAERAEPGDHRGKVSYSNFGMALLGHALAAHTQKPYAQLVTERILTPLGLSATTIDPAPADRSPGSRATGSQVDPWSSTGYAPAGVGPRSTAADLGKLVAATLAGTAPGADAATPRFTDGDGSRIGYAWFTTRYGTQEITWHNGATGGFTSYVAFDPAAGKGVVVLGNTDRPVERIGLRLLGATPPEESRSVVLPVVTVLLLTWAASALLYLAASARRTVPEAGKAAWWESKPDRLRAVGTVLSTAALLVLLHRIGAWLVIPPATWAVAAGLAVAGLIAVAATWRNLPTHTGGAAWIRWAGLTISAMISTAVIVAVS